MKPVVIALAFALLLHSQTLPPNPEAKQQEELNQAVGEAGQSAIDVVHALENHLAKYPNTSRRTAIEQSLYNSAVELNDSDRIILYGERILKNPARDLQIFDRVSVELIRKGDPASAIRALGYIKRYRTGIAELRNQNPPPQHLTPGQWSDQMDRAEARALALASRAMAITGDYEEGLGLAKTSWAIFPNAEAARSMATLLMKLGRNAEAIQPLAEAFAMQDGGTTEADRAIDRARLNTVYTKVKGSEQGLGEVVLEAYDRTEAAKKDHADELSKKDPNAVADSIYDFTLQSVSTNTPLPLSTLKGKVLVLDFWATWCVPCRAQHPMLEEVNKRFANNPNVVFLPLDSDDDLKLAAPFLKEQKWTEQSWFEGGLERKMTVTGIPTVVIIDPTGKVHSRMNGLIADRFEAMLTDRITAALAVKP